MTTLVEHLVDSRVRPHAFTALGERFRGTRATHGRVLRTEIPSYCLAARVQRLSCDEYEEA